MILTGDVVAFPPYRNPLRICAHCVSSSPDQPAVSEGPAAKLRCEDLCSDIAKIVLDERSGKSQIERLIVNTGQG